MLVGAIAGALLLKVDLALVLALACLLAILTWVIFMPAARAAEGEGEAREREPGSSL
ncbi:MAG TPA: hypothetical protein VKH20_00515 [Solirubrobacterales bacterium]|nr:hypothetical protein [Solirubrobacterales bacterium]